MQMSPMFSCVAISLMLLPFAISYDCPLPCNCRDNNRTVLCNRTKLSEVPKDLPKNVVTLNLSYNRIKSIPPFAFRGLNQLQDLDLSGNHFKANSFQNGCLNSSSIQTLSLSFGSYRSVPKGLPPNITTLNFFNNQITKLTADSFVNVSSIQCLRLGLNKLNLIENHTFDPLVNALRIDLSFNKLHDNSFSPLSFIKNTKLNNLDLGSNAFKYFPNTSFYPVTLERLSFAGNKIKVIPPYAFRTLVNIQTLSIYEVEIETLQENAFYGLERLTDLSFYEDNVSSILTNQTFAGLSSIQQLSFSSNNVSIIRPGTLNPMKNIEKLYLDSNRLKTLEQEVLDLNILRNLSALSIHRNPWICDCHLKWLRQLLDTYPDLIAVPHLVSCDKPPALKGLTWDILKSTDFVCS